MFHSSPDFFKKLDVYLPVLDSFSTKDLEKMTLCIKENRYYQNGLCLEKIGEVDGFDITSLRLSKERRGIAISIEHTLVLVKHLQKHNYPSQEELKQYCRTVIHQYHDLFEKYFQNIPFFDSRETIVKERGFSIEQLTLCYNQSKITLDQEQSDICYTTLPAKVQGGPGAGKSLVGLFMLKEHNHGNIGYYAKSSFLVEKQKIYLQEQELDPEREQSVFFLSFNDLYPLEKTFFKRDLIRWVDMSIKRLSPALRDLSRSYVLQDLQILYVLEKFFPDQFWSLYRENFSSSSFNTEQVSAIAELFNLFQDRFLNQLEKPFVEGFVCADPIPETLLSKFIIDENQDCTIAENFFFLQKTENAQILFLRDIKQSQEWQGIDPLTLFESIWHTWLIQKHKKAVRIQSLYLSKSYRNAPAVTALANRILRLLNLWLDGTVHKNEHPLLETQHAKGGQVRLYSSVHSPDYLAIQDHLPENSTQWAVITRLEHKEEARSLFGPNVLVFTTNEVAGLEFCCVVRYKVTDRRLLSMQDGQKLKELLNNPDLPLSLNKSNVLERNVELIQAIGADVTCTTRARDLVLVIEPDLCAQDFDSKKKFKTVKDVFSYLYPIDQYRNDTDPWIVNMTASSLDEWSLFIKQLYENNLEIEAERLFAIHLQSATNLTFSKWVENLFLKKQQKNSAIPRSEEHLQIATPVETPMIKAPSPEPMLIKKDTPSASFSHKKYKNIKNILTCINLNAQLVNIESESDLAELLFDNLVILSSDKKNLLKHATHANQNEALSLSAFLARGSDKVRGFIQSKIEKMLNIGSIKKKISTIDFFCQPCPEDLKNFLQESSGVQKEYPNLGAGLFWLLIHYPETVILLELFLLVKNRNNSLLPNDCKPTVDFLYQDWKEHMASHITAEILNSEGYEHVEQFFSKYIRKKLELKMPLDRNPDALVYNIIFSEQENNPASSNNSSVIVPLLLKAVAALNHKERYHCYLTYRSSQTGLNALELAISFRNKKVIAFLLKELRALYENGLTLPRNALSLLWQDISFYLDDLDAFQNILVDAIESELWPAPELCRIDLLFRVALSLEISSISTNFFRFLQYCHELEKEGPVSQGIIPISERHRNLYFQKSILELLLKKKFFEIAKNLLEDGLDPLPLSVEIDLTQLSYEVNELYPPLIKTPKILMHVWKNLVKTCLICNMPMDLFSLILEKSQHKFADFKEALNFSLLLIHFYESLIIEDLSEAQRTKKKYITALVKIILNKSGLKITDRISCSEKHGLSLLHKPLFSYSINKFSAIKKIGSTRDPNKTYYDVSLFCFLLDFSNAAIIEYALNLIKKSLMCDHNDEENAFIMENFCISLEPQKINKGIDTLLTMAIKQNKSGLALLLIESGIDIISHRDLSKAPITEMLENLNSAPRSLNEIGQKDQWRSVIKAIIPRLHAIEKSYDFIKDNKRDSESHSRSYFVDLVLRQEFDLATQLISWKVIDVAPTIKNEKTKDTLNKYLFCLSGGYRNASALLLLQSFILTALTDSTLLKLMMPIFLDALEHAIRNEDIEYVNIFFDEIPQLVFGSRLTNPDYNYTQNGTLLGYTFKDCHRKNPDALKHIALKICDTLVRLEINPEIIQEYINAPCHPKSQDINETVLFFALHCQLFDVANRLIEMGGLLLSTHDHLSLFLQALAVRAPSNTLISIVKKIAQADALDHCFSYKEFIESCASYNPSIRDLLRDSEGPQKSYSEIIILSKDPDVIECFFQLGGNLRYERIYQILFFIINSNNPDILELVLHNMKEKGCLLEWIDSCNRKKNTPLDIAFSLYISENNIDNIEKHKKNILLLINAGCTITARTKGKVQCISDEMLKEALGRLPVLDSRSAEPLLFSQNREAVDRDSTKEICSPMLNEEVREASEGMAKKKETRKNPTHRQFH